MPEFTNYDSFSLMFLPNHWTRFIQLITSKELWPQSCGEIIRQSLSRSLEYTASRHWLRLLKAEFNYLKMFPNHNHVHLTMTEVIGF